MHFSAKRGIAIACRLSVCPSVCPSVTLVDCDHIGWNSSKIISPLVSLGCSLFATPTWPVCSKGNTHKFGPKVHRRRQPYNRGSTCCPIICAGPALNVKCCPITEKYVNHRELMNTSNSYCCHKGCQTMQHSLRGALARTMHCIPVWSASTSAPLWSDTAAAHTGSPWP